MMTTMKALVCSEPKKFEYQTREQPGNALNKAIIKIKRIGVCGTDLHAYEGTQPFLSYPRILGHELAGELVSADNAPGFHTGEVVALIPYFSCGVCVACQAGKQNCCTSIKVCGVHVDGGMTEYLS
jgi:threonine dehydrogenase-like Zn-dependent dehydrogenase